MKIFVTGASGFVGLELVSQLIHEGHELRLWHRSDLAPEQFLRWENQLGDQIELVRGQLGEGRELEAVQGCDAVVHAALWREDRSFQDPPNSLLKYLEINFMGSLRLIEAAMQQHVKRFVYLSTCAVHDKILSDRSLDEAHPLWARSHYGAHKAAVEKFVHSFGHGAGFPICALRPSAIFGVASPIEHSKWFDLIADVVAGRTVNPTGGSKEVHVSDVAKAIRLLLDAPADKITGEAFSCCDTFYSHHDVATLAKQISASPAKILGSQKSPKHSIDTKKLQSLGIEFGGNQSFKQTVADICQYLTGQTDR